LLLIWDVRQALLVACTYNYDAIRLLLSSIAPFSFTFNAISIIRRMASNVWAGLAAALPIPQREQRVLGAYVARSQIVPKPHVPLKKRTNDGG